MPADLTIQGAEQLAEVAKLLKQTGDKDLRKELFRGFNRATKPLKEAAKDAARRELPKRGGLNEWAASSRMATRTRTSGQNVGVRIVSTKKGHDLRSLNRGRLRHPLFGNRRFWFNQPVKTWWFDDAMKGKAGAVRKELVVVLDDVARKVARG